MNKEEFIEKISNYDINLLKCYLETAFDELAKYFFGGVPIK
jgi:hypothetical protein